jgi:NAD(P)-dependent dehydrogenase (short-subunit alcohol dehydrogenase family)
MGLVAPCWTSRITVNIIAPGPIEPIQTLPAAISQAQQFPDTSIRISPQDIAELIAFLCSTKGRYLTGNIFTFNF